MSSLVVSNVSKRILQEPVGEERTVFSAHGVPMGQSSAIGNEIGTVTGLLHPTPTQMVVDGLKFVALKVCIGRAVAYLGFLDDCDGLLTKFKERLEQKRTDLAIVLATW